MPLTCYGPALCGFQPINETFAMRASNDGQGWEDKWLFIDNKGPLKDG